MWVTVVAALWSHVQAAGWSLRGAHVAHQWRGGTAEAQTRWTDQHHPGNGRWCVMSAASGNVVRIPAAVLLSASLSMLLTRMCLSHQAV